MKFGAIALSLGLAVTALSACSRHKQEAVKLANEGDRVVELSPSEAIEKYEQAVELDPSNHYIMYKLAKAYKDKKEWDKVASVLGRATERAPSFANYWKERGWALYQQAKKGTIDYSEAAPPFQKCIEHDPNKDECYYWLGMTMLYGDKEQEALKYFTKAIEHRPDHVKDYYTRLADFYIRLNYYDEAQQVLEAAKQMADPNKHKKELAQVHTLLAKVYREKDDIQKMVDELEAAKSINPDDAGLLFSLGMAYSKLDPPKKAQSLKMLKGFDKRACTSKKKAKVYKSECAQTRSTIQRLKGPGS